MLILGINDGHNAAAALYEDGRLLAAIGEERLRRVKNWSGFPEQAVAACLRIAGRRLDEVDRVAIAGLAPAFRSESRERLIADYRERSAAVPRATRRLRRSLVAAAYRLLGDVYRGTALWRRRDRERRARRLADAVALGIPADRITIVEHHAAHAAAAYYGWGRFDGDVLVLTNDGAGDDLCATVSVGRDGRLRRLQAVGWEESIGSLYAMVTCLLGMVPLEHEHKVMGMAPYAEERGAAGVCRDLAALFAFDGGGLSWRRQNHCPETLYSYYYFKRLLELRRFDSVCGGLQRFTEQFMSQWVTNCIRATGIRRVALAGGLFMNVKLNKVITELPEVEELFVFPSCGDETNAMGAAYHVYAEHADCRAMRPISDVYWGPEYGDDEIGRAIEGYAFKSAVEVRRPSCIAEAVAEALAGGAVVARFDGREEFGARALGNRSILADPSGPRVVKTINDAIKGRDFWMPFAPSVLDRRAGDYFVNPKGVAAPYMILCFDATTAGAQCPAVCHPYDLSLRPQVVYRDWNPGYYALLEAFERRTGKGIVLNTSFNLHGYPIVSQPRDALHVFDESGLDGLAIGAYLLRKRR